MLVIANFTDCAFASAILTITKFSDQVRIRLILQLIKNTSSEFSKSYLNISMELLLNCYSTPFVPAALVLPVNFKLNLNNSGSATGSFNTSLQYCFKLFELLSLYSEKLYIHITRSIYLTLLTLVYGLFHLFR